jgi:UPF0716 protein FxsA
MNVAKWLTAGLLALPLAELIAFILVVAAVGLLWAVGLQLLCSLVGLMVLRHAGGTHISRLRVALDQGSVTALNADGSGSLTLLGGILLFIPGFITDFLGLMLLLGNAFRRGPRPAPGEGVIDLPPEQWHRVDDPALADRREDDRQR